MITRKSISTISFNTPEHLEKVLKRLTFEKTLTFWCFIKHKAEDDEGGKKDHIHLYIEPSKKVDTELLRDLFKEVDRELAPDSISESTEEITLMKDTRFLGVLPFTNSRFDDWEQYVLHDPLYLRQHLQERKFQYSTADLVNSDQDYLNYKIKSINMLERTAYHRILEAQDINLTWYEFLASGTVPLPQIRAYKEAWDALMHLK